MDDSRTPLVESPPPPPRTRRGIPLLAAIALLGLTGCANRSLVRFEKIAQAAAKEDYLAAAERVRKEKDLYGNHNRLLFNMDLGLLFHYAGQWDSSIAYLAKAVKIHDELFARSVTNEAVSFVANDNARPYRGRPHEMVLVHQFLAFNYLAQGRPDEARVEARQGQMLIDEIKRKAGKGHFRDDGMFRYFSALTYEANREPDDAAIAYYHAVKAYQEGPVPLPGAVARQARTVLAARGRDNDVVQLGLSGDAAASKANYGGTQPAGDAEGEIVVVGHAGRSPTVDQNVFWGTWVRDGVMVVHYRTPEGEVLTEALPAPGLPPQELGKHGGRTRSGTTLHVKFAMPALKAVPSKTRFFSVTGAGLPAPVRTEALTDLERLLRKNLADEKGATLARTITRVVVRTLASEQTKEALSGGNPLLNLFLNIGTDVLADQLEQADARCWFLLPRTIQVARIPARPGTHSITVEAHDGAGGTLKARTFDNLEVKAGRKTYVFVPSLQ